LLRAYFNRSAKSRRESDEPPPRHALLSLRATVILAIATGGGLLSAQWAGPGFGLGAWLTLVIGLDSIIDR
jgi:hypothetical protein